MVNNLLNHLSEESRSVYRKDAVQSCVFNTLIYTVFQQPHERDSSGIVIAVSSARPSEGVTYFTRALVKELAKFDVTSVAGINARFLRRQHEPTMEALRESMSRLAPGTGSRLWESGGAETSFIRAEGSGPWEGSWQYRRDCINLLRGEFDQTVIDCPSLKESGDLLSVAPFVDGVILLIEANRTRLDELRQAEQQIAAVHGRLLGYVLNKRTYDVPGWLFRRL